jgi:hypothetical protein
MTVDTDFQTWDEVADAVEQRLDRVRERDDGEQSGAVDELWTVVDAFDERLDEVELEGLDDDATDDETPDLDDIPDSLVSADPSRAVKLRRLLQLVDVGRTSEAIGVDAYLASSESDDDEEAAGSVDDESEGGDGGAAQSPAESDAERSADETSEGAPGEDESAEDSSHGDDSPGDSSDEDDSAEANTDGDSSVETSEGERIKSNLQEAIEGFREGVTRVRDEFDESDEETTASSDGESGAEGASDGEAASVDEGGAKEPEASGDSDSGSQGRSTQRSRRRSSALSTVPASRSDMGSRAHVSISRRKSPPSGIYERGGSGTNSGNQTDADRDGEDDADDDDEAVED